MKDIMQNRPYMDILNSEQIMDAYAITRKIQSATTCNDICVRFYGLKAGTDIWISAEELLAYDKNMAEFLHHHCEIDEDIAKRIANSDYEIVAAKGVVEHCLTQPKGFDWEKYAEIAAVMDDFDEEVIEAAIKCGIPFGKIGDAYQGCYRCFKDFAQEHFDEFHMNKIPEQYQHLIDIDAYIRDLEANSDFTHHDGYVFESV